MSKDKEEMVDQAAGLRHLSRSKPVKVIAVTAGKGGVGKSNVSVNLALALAQREKNVLLLDADLGLANIDVMLGLHAKYNLSHVVQGLCHLSDIILTGPNGIRIIPAASGTEYMTQLSSVEHAGIIDAFNELTDDVDYMIIDTAAGISDTVLSFARSSQELIVIVCDEPTSLTDAYALIKVMSKRYEWSHFHILTNMVRSTREGKELFNKLYRVAEQFLDVRLDYLGAIPFDDKIHEAVKKQKPVLISYPESTAAKSFIQLADTVEDWPYKPLLGGNTSFFIERLVAGEY
ncbi:MinD/ParA family protein [Legionella micdadei]|uniref:Flagellar biosynthesis MinD n=2 Tax=Legionella micdadei TaxID=451 RepID=A0A098GEJ2_LEGMI|nr:MinD/ParA family protein [Legionella micdadei]ARG97961.1 cobyrinic acid a,c-diamide synthase [Legionella micdadei]ARG99720.1 cobyrinic acid a,c-diamide synthase [Legionella micdadei]KTD30242.1 flagellar biosynthesis MinD [Legionella micdadei]NSL19216.1 MinD/ParA family protein [Legionella micdadei]CEG60417.1 Flagellar biosynthesis MinD [Legionella micdadei]